MNKPMSELLVHIKDEEEEPTEEEDAAPEAPPVSMQVPYEPRYKTTSIFPTRCDRNRPVQSQKNARCLKGVVSRYMKFTLGSAHAPIFLILCILLTWCITTSLVI